MAALQWMLIRSVTTTVVASFVVAGISSGTLLWASRRAETRMTTKLCRMQRRMANLAGEVSALRDDAESYPEH